jgi:AraC-like DNA-binding protein
MSISKAKMPRAFGALSTKMPDYLYALSGGRHIYTSPWVDEGPLRRCSASIGLTAYGQQFELSAEKKTALYSAVAIRPMIERVLRAHDVAIIGFQFDPSHPLFPRFRRIPAPGVLGLNRDVFRELDSRFDAAYRGVLTIDEAGELFDAVTRLALPLFPDDVPIDRRVSKAIDKLWEEPNIALGDLASTVGVSYYRLSHLFTENMGMTLRSYQQWRKIRKAISLSKYNYTLTELALAAGFADAAHFSRAFVQLHAAPPSYFLQSGNVKIIAPPVKGPPVPLATGGESKTE